MTDRRRDTALALALGLLLPAAGAAQSLILDADAERVLAATPRPAPPGTDPVLRLQVRLQRAGAPVASALDDEDWSFARLLPDDRFLGVTPDGHLFVSPLDSGAPESAAVLVDAFVEGAVGSSPDGRHLVYCRGVAPELEVFRADDGRIRPVTTDMSPVWSPAISPDGRSVVFVSARTGVPALYRVDGDAPPRQLTNVGVRPRPGVVPTLAPYPDALTPPLLSADAIVFESRGAVYVLDAAGRTRHVERRASSPTWEAVGRSIRVFRPGQKTPDVLVLPTAEPRR